MNDNKSRDIFYGVVAVATLIVALIGATLAYFSITVNSEEGAVSARGAVVTINYVDGKNIVAQAEELIPATFEVVKNVYEHNIDAINEQANSNAEDKTNVCIDANGKEVCSIHRFTVSSEDGTRTIEPKFYSENNEFEYLAYAVRDVNNDTWINLYDGEDVKYLAMNKCSGDDATNGCYTISGETKTYNANATHNIFGTDTSDNAKTREITATEQVYDIVLFINENRGNQNVDQGKSYSGTLQIDVVGGNQEISGRAYQ